MSDIKSKNHANFKKFKKKRLRKGLKLSRPADLPRGNKIGRYLDDDFAPDLVRFKKSLPVS